MLSHLSIKGLAIIEELNIDFSAGFCVITGETGAGKSILIKALNLLFGGKVNTTSVRKGFEKATVSGQFLLPQDHDAIKVLQDLDIHTEIEDDKAELIIRRTMNNKGRTQAWINDVSVTTSALKQVAQSLVDIFGQHENTRLLDSTTHTFYLDQFLKDKKILSEIALLHQSNIKSLQSLRKMVESYKDSQRSSDYLSFRVKELDKFSPAKDDYLELQNSCRDSAKQLEVKETLDKIQYNIDSSVGGEVVSKPLWDAHYLLNKLSEYDASFKDLAQTAAEIAGKIDDFSFDLGKHACHFNFDEEDLEFKQKRLATYQDLFRKLLVSGIDELLEEYIKLQKELEFLDHAAEKAQLELTQLKESSSKLHVLAKKLSKARQEAAKVLKSRVESEFNDLAMPGAIFDIHFEPTIHVVPDLDVSLFGEKIELLWADVCEMLSEQGLHGTEKANFMLSANQGEPMMPLNKIASGGEISRIMLALKKALLAGANTCILVFDEIDTGISGRVASMVGKKMKELSKDFQIICISHLPQVAAFADSHYLVHKFGRENRTESTIVKLSKQESVEEIAKLLSGDKVSKTSLANAKSLIEKASSM